MRYLIDDNHGALTVYADDGTRIRYSAAFWESIEDRPDPSVPEVTEVDIS